MRIGRGKYNKFVTLRQAEELKKIGFDDKVPHYVINEMKPQLYSGKPENWNKSHYIHKWGPSLKNSLIYTSIPTCDEALDFLERKYHFCAYARRLIVPGKNLFVGFISEGVGSYSATSRYFLSKHAAQRCIISKLIADVRQQIRIKTNKHKLL